MDCYFDCCFDVDTVVSIMTQQLNHVLTVKGERGVKGTLEGKVRKGLRGHWRAR